MRSISKASLSSRYCNYLQDVLQLSPHDIMIEVNTFEHTDFDDVYVSGILTIVEARWNRWRRALSYVGKLGLFLICNYLILTLSCLAISSECPPHTIAIGSKYCLNDTGAYMPTNRTCPWNTTKVHDNIPHCLNETDHTIFDQSIATPFTEGVCGMFSNWAFMASIGAFMLLYSGAVVYTFFEPGIVMQKTKVYYLGEFFKQ